MIHVKSVKRQETRLCLVSTGTWLRKPDNLALQVGQLGFASWTTWLRKLDNLNSQVGQLGFASWTTCYMS
jgi:hypothetical protein